jgi:hypothetical protein
MQGALCRDIEANKTQLIRNKRQYYLFAHAALYSLTKQWTVQPPLP